MKIGINASFLRKKDSGIGQVSWNFIQTLINSNQSEEKGKKNDDISFILYLEEDIDWELPAGFEKRVFLPNRYKRDDLVRKIIWEKYLLPDQVQQDECDVFFSLYQSATIFNNSSPSATRKDTKICVQDSPKTIPAKPIRHVMLVHDMVWRVFPKYKNNWRKKIYYQLVDKAIKQADQLITISQNSKKDIEKYIFKIKPVTCQKTTSAGVQKFVSFQSDQSIPVIYEDCDPIFKQALSDEQMVLILKKYGLTKELSTIEKKSADIKKGANTEFIKIVPTIQSANQPTSAAADGNGEQSQLVPTNYILYLGGFDIRKNVDHLIAAYGKLYQKMRQKTPQLVIAGKFHPKLVPLITNIPQKIQEIVDCYEMPKIKVKKLDQFIPQEDLPALYKGAKLFCYPSLYEGFGLPILEALSMGCPVLTSNTSSIPELVDNQSAILVDPKIIKTIAEGMYRGITDDQLRQKITINGKSRARQFSWETFTNKVMEILIRAH